MDVTATRLTPSRSTVTNHDIYAGYLELKECGTGTQTEVLEMCRKLFNLDNSLLPKSRMTSIYNKVVKVHKKMLEYNRNKATKSKHIFLESEFHLPQMETNFERSLLSSKTEKEMQLKTELTMTKHENKQLKRKIEKVESENEDLNFKVNDLVFRYVNKIQQINKNSNTLIERIKESRDDHDVLTNELEIMKQNFESNSTELDQLQEQYEKLRIKLKSDNVRNLNKRLKRRDSKIEKLEGDLSNLRDKENEREIRNAKLDECREKLTQKEVDYDYLNEKLRKLQFKLSYLKRKFDSQKTKNDEMQNEMQVLEQKTSLLLLEKAELNQLIDILNDDEIVTFENGRYYDEVRETIMELLSLNVSMNKVNDVIRTVIQKLTKKSVGRLPSNAVKSRLLLEARHLAHVQVAEAMLEGGVDGLKGNCLHGDDTSKYHRHYQNCQITLASGQTISLGLKELAGGDTAAIMKSFTDTIDDLSIALFEDEGTDRLSCVDQMITSV